MIDRISDIIQDVIGNISCQKNTGEERNSDIESIWCKLIKPHMRAHSYVVRERGSCLIVKVDSSTYLLEFELCRKQITKDIRKKTAGKIKRIIFVI